MGSGKSSTGRALAALLDWEFTDLDAYITKKIGRSPAEIIRTDGEVRFRAIEAEALRDVVVMHQLTGGDLVLALGGGTIMTTSTRRLILEDTFCVYLRASEEKLRERSQTWKTPRPLADGRFAERLASRIPVYEQAAVTVDTDGKTQDEIAAEIRLEMIKMNL